jgi:twinkle protein
MQDIWVKLGIEPKGTRDNQKVKCPNCKAIGKTNHNDTCLSIELSTGLYNCHKCGWKGCAMPNENIRVYTKPDKTNFTKLSDEALAFFTDRKISQPSVINNKIAMSKDGKHIVFPYLKNGELINFKTREIGKKDFRQAKDAQAIMFNYDRCVGQKEIIICEGEIDAMSYDTVGFPNSTSVNQGAPNVNDTNIDKKLECITNCYELFENAEKIYLAVDMDENGRRLQMELIRRFGQEKCLTVDFGDCKDANELLCRHGIMALRETIQKAKEVPVSGVFRAENVWDDMLDGFKNGKPRGTTTYMSEIDEAWTWRNEVTVWTGYQNEGKTTFLLQASMLKAYWEGWKFAVFSPENMPISEFYDDLIETFIGKPVDPGFGKMQMTMTEYKEGFEFVNKHFFVIYPEQDFELESIFEKSKYLIRKEGCRSLIIDPYNTIEHKMKSGEREDLYISRFMGNLKRFSNDNQINIQLVAHQLTPQKDSGGRYLRPDTNRIKGGGTFSDKTDNSVFIWRPNRALDFGDTQVVFGSQKIKKQKLTGIPQDVEGIIFDRFKNRYFINGKSPFEDIDKDRMKDKEQPDIFDTIPTIQPNNNFDGDCPF